METIERFEEIFKSCPSNVIETEFYKNVERLKYEEISYEKIYFLLELSGYIGEYKDFILNSQSDIVHLSYIKKIIRNKNIAKREKIIIILPHIETMALEAMNININGKYKIKEEINKKIESIDSYSAYDLGCVFLLGIVYSVFASTDFFKNPCDRRLPFRNYILHKGTIEEYSRKEINYTYKVLLIFICVIVRIYEQSKNKI